MKGTGWFIAIILLAVLAVVIVGFGVTLNISGGGEGAVAKTTLQSDIYTMSNALEASKLYMDTSLGYSLYQACYDNLARGGRASITTDTGQTISDRQYAYLTSSFTQDNFLNELASSMKTNLNRYSDSSYVFLSEYRVSIPDYTDVSIEPDVSDPSKLSVSTVTSGSMVTTARAESGESIILHGPADLSGQYSIPCLTLFLKAQELSPSIEQAFKAAFSEAFDQLGDMETACDSIESCSSEFTEDFSKNLDAKLKAGLPKEQAGYEIHSELLQASVIVTSIERIEEKILRTYTANAIQKVTVRESSPPEDHFYPVWNGREISFEDLELVFINKASS